MGGLGRRDRGRRPEGEEALVHGEGRQGADLEVGEVAGQPGGHRPLGVVAAVVAHDPADVADAGRHHLVGQGLHRRGQAGLAHVAALDGEVGGRQERVAASDQPQVADGAAGRGRRGPDVGHEPGVRADLGQRHRGDDQLEGRGGDQGEVGLAGVERPPGGLLHGQAGAVLGPALHRLVELGGHPGGGDGAGQRPGQPPQAHHRRGELRRRGVLGCRGGRRGHDGGEGQRQGRGQGDDQAAAAHRWLRIGAPGVRSGRRQRFCSRSPGSSPDSREQNLVSGRGARPGAGA